MAVSPTLVVLAAGMGSRYGGLKQMDPMDPAGNVIIDYSLYDAYRAGFRHVIFIVRRDTHDDFHEMIGRRASEHFSVEYVIQDLKDIPGVYKLPEGREKPWGTAHAVYCCRANVKGPIAVINADDYYGVDAFKQIYDFLAEDHAGDVPRYAMVGYRLGNTVSDQGYVARGVCTVENDMLTSITERTRIEKRPDGICFSEDEGETWTKLPEDTIVSMNFWGFSKDIIDRAGDRLAEFLDKEIPVNPLKCEFYLPNLVGELLKENRCQVSMLTSGDRWYGVTYKEDKPVVMDAFVQMKKQGLYPEGLWR